MYYIFEILLIIKRYKYYEFLYIQHIKDNWTY